VQRKYQSDNSYTQIKILDFSPTFYDYSMASHRTLHGTIYIQSIF